MSSVRGERDAPDRRKGGMSEAEKGKGKLHMLHEGEIILNRPTTKLLLDAVGVSKKTAMSMTPSALMGRVKGAITGAKKSIKGAVKSELKRAGQKVLDARAKAEAKKAPARRKGGMARPARVAPSRRKGGMSAADMRAENDKKAGRMPRYDTL